MATQKITVNAGATSDAQFGLGNNGGIGATITAVPGGGGTMTVQYSTSTEDDIKAGTGNWQNWPKGSVSAIGSDTLVGRVTAVRASAVTAAGTLEIRS